MKLKLSLQILTLCLIGMTFTACGKKSFETASLSTVADDDDTIFEPPVTDDDDDVVVPPVDPVVCPRYDLIVDSVDQQTAHRNYRFIFNSEMKQTAIQGEIDVNFQQNSSTVNYINCSGSFTNTAISPTMLPLDLTEALTKQILISHGKVCNSTPTHYATVRVVDNTTGRMLFDEQVWRQQNGACEFGYTTEGQSIRRQLVDFSRAIVDIKAAACL